MNCPYCNKPLYHPTGKPTLSCANWNCMETDNIIGNHSAWEKIIELKSQLDKAKWWLNEIVKSHRCTPISTAEMALKEINSLDDRMIGCTTLDIPESYKELHKAVESANVKLAGKYDIAVDALLRIKQQKMRLIENEERVGLLLDVFDIAEKAIDKLAEKNKQA